MIIGVPTETAADETRVALIPPVAEDFVEDGFDVVVAAGAGEEAGWTDEDYRDVGCEVVDDRSDVFERADIVFQVRGLGANPDADLDPYREGQIVIGLLAPYEIDDEDLEVLADRNVSAFSLELIPRISRAQSMDALSSMANIAGYKSTVMAAEKLPKIFPMLMTAAGTIRPADVFVIGAGVAGLQAIATAERLGAEVRGYDIRLEVKQEVESLGADFVELDIETEGSGDEEGYAREMDETFYEEQRKALSRVVADSDVVITTAAIPGQPAPELVSEEMIEDMDRGSVIVDVVAADGGNCEPTRAGETVRHEGVTIIGPKNLPGTVANHASELYSNNLNSFLQNLLEDGELTIDTDDEIVDSTLLTHDGTVREPHLDDESEETDEADADDESEGADEGEEQETQTDDD